MTTVQLNAALHRELSHIVTDETMMKRALQSFRKIRRERRAEQLQQGDSAEQVKKSLKRLSRSLNWYKRERSKQNQ